MTSSKKMSLIPLGLIFIYNRVKIISQTLAFNCDTQIESDQPVRSQCSSSRRLVFIAITKILVNREGLSAIEAVVSRYTQGASSVRRMVQQMLCCQKRGQERILVSALYLT